jgi:hypothetical protein
MYGMVIYLQLILISNPEVVVGEREREREREMRK